MTPLKAARTKRELTIRDVAQACGCSFVTISRIERGDSTTPELAEKISRYFDGEVTELQILYPERFSETAAGHVT